MRNKQHMTNLNTELKDIVEEKTWQILDSKAGTPTRQAIATTRGQQVEVAASEMLQQHPAVVEVKTQVFVEEVDEFSNIDLVVNLKNGTTVHVPCARDLWLGTSQQDRLQLVWEKHKAGICKKHNVVYLVLDDVDDILTKKFTQRARRGKKIQECCTTLYKEKALMNMSQLWAYLEVANTN
jgi:hypothetical protein